tara:strand:+ start:4507 stop:4953 length:447 start_codon:yes stop_codon:yes gene_type:complete
MTKVWGPITWELLHAISYKINESYFLDNKKAVLMIILNILISLPCPECSDHSIQIYKLNFKKIVNKKTFIEFIFLLHNAVNTKLKKRVESFEILKKYENIDIKNTIIKWYNTINALKGIPKLMAINMNNKIIRNNIMKFFKENINHFT